MTWGTGDWKQLILDAVNDVADEAFQRRSWFGGAQRISTPDFQEVSSPDEVINRLFSDLDFEDFLDSPKAHLTTAQHQSGLALKKIMNDFIAETPTFLEPKHVIDAPAGAKFGGSPRNSYRHYAPEFSAIEARNKRVSMAEVADSGEDHRYSESVGGSDYVTVIH